MSPHVIKRHRQARKMAFAVLAVFCSICFPLRMHAQSDGNQKPPTTLMPTDFTSPPPDPETGINFKKRVPTIGNSPTEAGYEYPACKNNLKVWISATSDCAEGTPIGSIPTTLFAVDETYRFTMKRLAPLLEDLEKRVALLNDPQSEPWRVVEANLKKQMQAQIEALQQQLTEVKAELQKRKQSDHGNGSKSLKK